MRGLERIEDLIDNAFRVLHDVVVPDTEHPVPRSLEEGCALCIRFGAAVMAASIQLDDQPGAGAEEVDYVRPPSDVDAGTWRLLTDGL